MIDFKYDEDEMATAIDLNYGEDEFGFYIDYMMWLIDLRDELIDGERFGGCNISTTSGYIIAKGNKLENLTAEW